MWQLRNATTNATRNLHCHLYCSRYRIEKTQRQQRRMDYMEWPKTVAIFLKYKYFLFLFNFQSRNTLLKNHSIMSLFCCSECAKMLYSQPQPFCYDRKHFNFDTTDISQSALRFFNTSSVDFFIRKDSKSWRIENIHGVYICRPLWRAAPPPPWWCGRTSRQTTTACSRWRSWRRRSCPATPRPPRPTTCRSASLETIHSDIA